MTHRAESILQTLQTTLTGLTSTGQQVARGRVFNVDTASLPALSIQMGPEQQLGDAQSFNRVTRELLVSVEIHARATAGLEAALNQIKAEVYAAIMADHTLGLSYVVQAEWREDSAPDFSDEFEQATARVYSTWAIFYQHSLTSAEA